MGRWIQKPAGGPDVAGQPEVAARGQQRAQRVVGREQGDGPEAFAPSSPHACDQRQPARIEIVADACRSQRIQPSLAGARRFLVRQPRIGVVRSAGGKVERDDTADVGILDARAEVFFGAKFAGQKVA